MPIVTVVPKDRLISVDGAALNLAFDAPETMHALQWDGQRGHIEWEDDYNWPLEPEAYEEEVAPYVALWRAEKERIENTKVKLNTLEQAKEAKLNEITMESNILFHRTTAFMTIAELMAAYWLKCEADAWLTGVEANVPLLKKVSATSGLSVNDLARAIVANYEKMAGHFGTAIGLKLAGELQIQDANTVEDVEKIAFNSARS